MPFIRLNGHLDKSVVDVNVSNIISFGIKPGNKHTTVELRDNITLSVSDTPRSIRSFIKKAEGLLPEKEEVMHNGYEPSDEMLGKA